MTSQHFKDKHESRGHQEGDQRELTDFCKVAPSSAHQQIVERQKRAETETRSCEALEWAGQSLSGLELCRRRVVSLLPQSTSSPSPSFDLVGCQVFRVRTPVSPRTLSHVHSYPRKPSSELLIDTHGPSPSSTPPPTSILTCDPDVRCQTRLIFLPPLVIATLIDLV